MNADGFTKRHLLISCQVFQREIEKCLKQTDVDIEVRYLTMGIHGDTSSNARAVIQEAVDQANPQQYDVVMIAYGLCNYGVRGLQARSLPLILPRHFDCISLLLNSRDRYKQLLHEEPNTYFKTSGWADAEGSESVAPLGNVATQLGIDQNLDTLVDKYGEENGKYIYDTLKPALYVRHLYIKTEVDGEPELVQKCQEQAHRKDSKFEVISGSTRCIEKLLTGHWDEEDFLFVPPRKQVELSHDDQLICWKEPSA